MALNRKGFRPLKSGERTFYWRARKAEVSAQGTARKGTARKGAAESEGTEPAILVTVVSSEAFKSGRTGQRLEFSVPRGSTVGPAAVRYVLEHTPEFTGRAGQVEITPTARVLAQARLLCTREQA